MNKVILMGRLTRDPEVRYSAGENATAVARYTLAVDRRFKRDGEATADFIQCVAFGRSAEFAAHTAPCLCGNTDRIPIVILHQNTFDDGAIFQGKQVFSGSIFFGKEPFHHFHAADFCFLF